MRARCQAANFGKGSNPRRVDFFELHLKSPLSAVLAAESETAVTLTPANTTEIILRNSKSDSCEKWIWVYHRSLGKTGNKAGFGNAPMMGGRYETTNEKPEIASLKKTGVKIAERTRRRNNAFGSTARFRWVRTCPVESGHMSSTYLTSMPLKTSRNWTDSLSFDDLMSDSTSRPFGEMISVSREELASPVPVPAPRSPRTMSESGLSNSHLSDLLLKTLYVHGILQGSDLARLIRLPFSVVEEPLRVLRDQRLVEAGASDLSGRVSYRFVLTEAGRTRAQEALEQNRYVGPAPVSLEQYVEHCQLQRVAGINCHPVSLRAVFQDYVLRPSMLDELGSALCGGKSVFLSGPPGNGKTVMAKGLGRFLNQFTSEIYVPYAILTESCLITLFDPGIHQTTDDADLAHRGMTSSANGSPTYPVQEGPVDARWRRIKRPVVVTGSELTLDLFELKYNKVANFYNAPLQIKANGGMLLIDDLGRQTVRSKDLINRWTVPLEEGVDYLTLATGRKCAIPLQQLTVFATNLDPNEIVDEAFLRRMKHKIRVEALRGNSIA